MTEDRMKAWLDGWFFTLDFAQGRTRSMVVPLDYIPDHRPILVEQEKGAVIYTKKPWSTEEDATILEMRADNAKWIAIAETIGRSAHAVRDRYRKLRGERRLDAYTGRIRHTKPVTPAVKAKIVQLRADGWSFGQIAKELGLTNNQVADHYHRIARRIMEKAA